MTPDKWNITLSPPSLSPWTPKKTDSKQIAALMSGGLDSTIAAHLLKQNGWEVLGITMKTPLSCDTPTPGYRQADAAPVCRQLNIPHYFVDVTEPFQKLIIEPFRQSYAVGRTPNPCVDCNTLLRFSLVWDFLQKTFGIDHLATGHYARVIETSRGPRLGRAKDFAKDQSYFLYGIAPEKLTRLVLPLGQHTKQQARSIAAELNLTVADRPESMELCFAKEGDYRAALLNSQANQPGSITDMQGNKMGTHRGIANYTLGQRHGIGFAGRKPLYVGKIDHQTNTVALGTKEQVSSRTVRANQINVLIPGELAPGKTAHGKIRSYGNPQPCKILNVAKADMAVEFDQPQFAPCPGQKLVLYDDDDTIIAGGTIY